MSTPTIIEQPSSQTILLGDGAVFNVNASDEGPLSYQWFKDNAEIVGATGNTYIIQTATLNDAGNYNATVTNVDGTTTSDIATLTVNTPVPPSPDTPTITSFAPTSGPSGQWIYMFGTHFIVGDTHIYFNTSKCDPVYVYNNNQIGFSIPTDVNTNGTFTVVTSNGEFTSSIKYVFAPATLTPTVTNLRDHPDPNSNWVYVDGTQFVNDQTTLTYDNNKTVNVFVYTTTSGGFSKIDVNDIITSVLLTTPYGSAEFTGSVAIL